MKHNVVIINTLLISSTKTSVKQVIFIQREYIFLSEKKYRLKVSKIQVNVKKYST